MITKYVTMKRSRTIIANSGQWSDYPFQTGKMWKGGLNYCRTSHAQHGELKKTCKSNTGEGTRRKNDYRVSYYTHNECL